MTEILLVSGSLRAGSVNTAVLEAARELVPGRVSATLYGGLAGLPHFNPDDDREPLHPAVADLRRGLERCSAVLFSTPEYAGSLPGSFKNLLDWTVGGGLYEKPAGWINPSPTGAGGAYASLRSVLGYVNARLVEEACVSIPVFRRAIDPDGRIRDDGLRQRISACVSALAGYLTAARG